MLQQIENEKRFVTVTAGNLRQNHIYITGHHDFFPKDCVGGSNGRTTKGKPIVLELDGLAKQIVTDIPIDSQSGKPRRHFRARGLWRPHVSRRRHREA